MSFVRNFGLPRLYCIHWPESVRDFKNSIAQSVINGIMMRDSLWSYYLGGTCRFFIFNATLLATIRFPCVTEYVSQTLFTLQTGFLVSCESTSITEWPAADAFLRVTCRDHRRVPVRLVVVAAICISNSHAAIRIVFGPVGPGQSQLMALWSAGQALLTTYQQRRRDCYVASPSDK